MSRAIEVRCHGSRTVRFQYRRSTFTLRRLAGGGSGGTGYFCSLVLDVDTGPRTVIAPSDAVKYVYAFKVPEKHSWITMAGTKTLVTGPAHDAIARRLTDPAHATFMQHLFPRHYSTVTIKPQVRLAIDHLPFRQWVIEMKGMPADVYERPEVLQPILDDALKLRDLIGQS